MTVTTLVTATLGTSGLELTRLGFGGAGIGELFEPVSARDAEATLTAGRNTTDVNRPPPPSCAIVPCARSTYPVTTTPWRAQSARYDSMWHWASAATSSCSGFHRAASPRNAESALPASAGGPSAVTSCSRP